MFSLESCGIMLEPQLGMSVEQLLKTAQDVERLGFGYLFRSDHLLPTDNRRGLDSPECWTSLGAIAAITSRLKFGPLVTPIGFRNPALLARMTCTVHSLSRGRLQLALGTGWYEPEFAAHGYDFPPFRVRKEQFEEALSIIVQMIREGRADFEGKYFRAHTDCLPRPNDRVHLIIGGRTKRIIRIAARLADEWNSLVSPLDLLIEGKNLLEKAAGGRAVEVSEMGPFLLGRSQSDLEANAKTQLAKLSQQGTPEELIKRFRSRGSFCGTPDEFSDLLIRKLDAGINKLYFQALVPENTAMTELLADAISSNA